MGIGASTRVNDAIRKHFRHLGRRRGARRPLTRRAYRLREDVILIYAEWSPRFMRCVRIGVERIHPNAAPLAGSIRLRETKIENPRIPILCRTENNTFSSS